MINRYSKRSVFRTSRLGMYRELMDARNVSGIRYYSTPDLDFPSVTEMGNLEILSHAWTDGDRLWKLAAQHYEGHSDLWWVIAWFNQTPTEGHIKVGDIIYIPLPLEKILNYLDV